MRLKKPGLIVDTSQSRKTTTKPHDHEVKKTLATLTAFGLIFTTGAPEFAPAASSEGCARILQLTARHEMGGDSSGDRKARASQIADMTETDGDDGGDGGSDEGDESAEETEDSKASKKAEKAAKKAEKAAHRADKLAENAK